MSAPKGGYVVDVTNDSPAAKSGVQKGDIIIAIDGKEAGDGSELRNQVAIKPIGSTVNVTVLRDKKSYILPVKVGSVEDATKALISSVEQKLEASFRLTTTAEQDRFGLNSGQGVVITRVDPKGPLGDVGFEKGDLILEINGQAMLYNEAASRWEPQPPERPHK